MSTRWHRRVATRLTPVPVSLFAADPTRSTSGSTPTFRSTSPSVAILLSDRVRPFARWAKFLFG